MENPTPSKVIALEQIFDRSDMIRDNKKEEQKPTNYVEINIGTEKEPKMIKIGKGINEKERLEIVKLVKEYRDVLAFTYDELKAHREDVIQHTIPLKNNVKPFRQKLRQINPKLAILVQKELKKMVDAGIIAPTRHSSWCSNLVIVKKKMGS